MCFIRTVPKMDVMYRIKISSYLSVLHNCSSTKTGNNEASLIQGSESVHKQLLTTLLTSKIVQNLYRFAVSSAFLFPIILILLKRSAHTAQDYIWICSIRRTDKFKICAQILINTISLKQFSIH